MLIIDFLISIIGGFVFGLLICIFAEDMSFGTMQTQWTPHYSSTWAKQISHEGLVTGTINWFMYSRQK